MEKNFYNNPLKIIWHGKKAILPIYLWIIWIIIIAFLLIGLCYDYIDFSSFDIHKYLPSTITGLSFTLALFVAEKNVFNMEELKQFAEHQGVNDPIKGIVLLELFAPFIFTAGVFLVLSIASLITPYISFNIDYSLSEFLKLLYISGFSLGIISLFNLLNMMFNDLYHKAHRDDAQ